MTMCMHVISFSRHFSFYVFTQVVASGSKLCQLKNKDVTEFTALMRK
jgi:hypothetical protein